MAHLVEQRVVPAAGVLLEIGVAAVHGLGAQEEAPACRTEATLHGAAPGSAATPSGGVDVLAAGGAALGRQPVGHRDRLDDRGLARAVLADQERDALVEGQPLRAAAARPPGSSAATRRGGRASSVGSVHPYDGWLVEVHAVTLRAGVDGVRIAFRHGLVEVALGGDRGRQPGGAGQQPRPGLLPGERGDQARPGRVLPGRRARHRQRAARAAVHAAPVPEGAGREEGAPEAAAGRRARLGRDRAAVLPALGPDRRRAVRDRARLGDLGGADVDRRVPPLEQPARRHREARRVADRPRPGRRVRLRHRAAGRARRPRGPRRARRGRLPEDLRRQGDARLRADPPRARLQGRTPRRPWPSRARSSGGRRTTSRPTWWRKDRDPRKLFVDYNQNARDHTIAAAYSVRGLPDARVSTPIDWDEVDDADPRDFTIFTVPERFAAPRRPARGHRRARLRHRPAPGVGRARRGRGQGDPRRARRRTERRGHGG